ncbi:MAG TPA: polyprenyl synthetase family protein, partial [Microbacterium sp.]|nr:polyprenyl synthetase family protein [Microbacterium sp.]
HADSGWAGDAAEFGTDAAILLGDLLLGWSDELLDEGLDPLADAPLNRAARDELGELAKTVTRRVH